MQPKEDNPIIMQLIPATPDTFAEFKVADEVALLPIVCWALRQRYTRFDPADKQPHLAQDVVGMTINGDEKFLVEVDSPTFIGEFLGYQYKLKLVQR